MSDLARDVQVLVQEWMQAEQDGVQFPVPLHEYWQDVNPQTFSFQVLGELARRARQANTIDECHSVFSLTSKVEKIGRTVYLGDVGSSILELCDAINVSVVHSQMIILKRKPEVQGRVYFLLDKTSRTVKIGWSTDVRGRVKSLENQSGRSLALLGSVAAESQKAETEIHRKFKHLRKKGEWFEYGIELQDFIKKKIGV